MGRDTDTTTAGLTWAASKIGLEFLIFFAMEAVTYTTLSAHWGPWMQGNEPAEEEEVEEVEEVEEEEIKEEVVEETTEEAVEGETGEGEVEETVVEVTEEE